MSTLTINLCYNIIHVNLGTHKYEIFKSVELVLNNFFNFLILICIRIIYYTFSETISSELVVLISNSYLYTCFVMLTYIIYYIGLCDYTTVRRSIQFVFRVYTSEKMSPVFIVII